MLEDLTAESSMEIFPMVYTKFMFSITKYILLHMNWDKNPLKKSSRNYPIVQIPNFWEIQVKERCKNLIRDVAIFIRTVFLQQAFISQLQRARCNPTMEWNIIALSLDRLRVYFKLFLWLIRSLVNLAKKANFKDRQLGEFCVETALNHSMKKTLQNA